MLTTVRYRGDGANFVWPVPFPFGRVEDVGASLADAAGNERRLAAGRDYLVRESSVVCLVPAGHNLTLWLDAPADGQLLANASRVASTLAPAASAVAEPAAAVAEPAAVPSPADEVAARLAASLAEANARVARLEARLEEILAARDAEAAEAVAAMRRQARDEQIAAVAREGETAVANVATQLEIACASIAEAGAEAADESRREAAHLLAIAVEARQSLASAEAAASRAADATQAADAAADRARASAAESVSSADGRMAALSDDYVEAVDRAGAAALENISRASASASREAAIASRLAGQAWPTQGWLAQAEDLASGSVMPLPEPLRYYPGRNSLYIALNGFMLTHGRDFQEVGSGSALSSAIRLLVPSHAGDIWSFWIAPTNSAQAAGEYAAAANRSAHDAAASAASAAGSVDAVRSIADKAVTEGDARLNDIERNGSQAVRNIATVRDNAKEELGALATAARRESVQVWNEAAAQIRKEAGASSDAARKTWADAQSGIAAARAEAQASAEAASAQAGNRAAAAQSMAEQARALAECAWQAAWQASLASARPGIAAAPSLAAIAALPSGIYVINPNLASHTPFMGVWPVKDFSEAKWDGFFFLGQPYPDNPELPDPPPYPEEPGQVPDMKPEASGTDWLPCGHGHG